MDSLTETVPNINLKCSCVHNIFVTVVNKRNQIMEMSGFPDYTLFSISLENKHPGYEYKLPIFCKLLSY